MYQVLHYCDGCQGIHPAVSWYYSKQPFAAEPSRWTCGLHYDSHPRTKRLGWQPLNGEELVRMLNEEWSSGLP